MAIQLHEIDPISLGRYEDAVFHVTAMGFPPAELAANSRAYFGNINFFGGPHEHSVSWTENFILQR